MDSKRIVSQIEKEILNAFDGTDTSYRVDEINTEKIDFDKRTQHMQVSLRNARDKANFGTRVQAASRTGEPTNSIKVAMVYQKREIGEIDIVLADRGMDINKIRAVFEHIAMDMAFFIKRQQVHKTIKEAKQLDLQWIGGSESAKKVDRFIERASCVDFPVVIHGETGSGKLLTAYSLHCHGARKQGPFIEAQCASWRHREVVEKMRSLWSKAKGGTLFLQNIDTLAEDDIIKIRHYWRHVVSASSVGKAGALQPVRLIASVSTQGTLQGSSAWHELDYLSIQLPSLRERKADIKELTLHYLNKLSYIKNVELSDGCWQLFERFDWKDNVQQLERMVSRLVVMSDSSYVDSNALLAIIPQLQDHQGNDISLNEPPSDIKPVPKAFNLDQLVSNIVADEYSVDSNQHPALCRAITHIAKAYMHEMSLGGLANIVCVSPSHLSYLFKRHLKVSFKQLLIRIRIAKAKSLLLEHQHSKIMEIAFDVGFRDLSHFEKTFRRLEGQSPGKYRKENSGR